MPKWVVCAMALAFALSSGADAAAICAADHHLVEIGSVEIVPSLFDLTADFAQETDPVTNTHLSIEDLPHGPAALAGLGVAAPESPAADGSGPGRTLIPEPMTFVLIGSGLLGLGFLRRRAQKP